jgi:hypothetical protein
MKQGRDGDGGNKSAERLKKPESAAQPGEVSLVWVAPHFQSAEEGETSRESVQLLITAFGLWGEEGRRESNRPSSGTKGHERKENFFN